MKLTITNNTKRKDIEDNIKLFHEFFSFAKNKLKFDQPVSLEFFSSQSNSKDPLGKTAYYDPKNNLIVVYVDDRHLKDMLRSFSHELIHHHQNCRGGFRDVETFDGYAQEDDYLRDMEKEAYLWGNMNFRDWEDNYKQSNQLVYEWVSLKVKKILRG